MASHEAHRPNPHNPEAGFSTASGSAFRVGNPELTQEYFKDGRKILQWVAGDLDESLADLAGWKNLPHALPRDEMGCLEIPAGTRSASSVLSGMEAWEGEKAEVLSFVAEYEKHVSEKFGGVDVGVNLDTVAVTKDRKFFIVPPHIVSREESDKSVWFMNWVKDLEQVLATEPSRRDLIDDYFRKMMAVNTKGKKQ